jgi:asparagine synthase (glutamine-hydrolysing)
MANSLEARVPFMDNDLVNFAMRCPIGLKLNNLGEVVRLNENEVGRKTNKYFQKTSDGKQILRDMMSKYIPSEIVEGKKQGFSSPDSSWFKGDSIDFVRKVIYNKKNKTYDYFDSNAVLSLVDEHLHGKKNRRLLIWSLLNFEKFLNEFNL